jgi:hypothetical protein
MHEYFIMNSVLEIIQHDELYSVVDTIYPWASGLLLNLWLS